MPDFADRTSRSLDATSPACCKNIARSCRINSTSPARASRPTAFLSRPIPIAVVRFASNASRRKLFWSKKMKAKRGTSKKDEPTLGLEIEMPGVSAQSPRSITALTATIRDLLETGLGEVWVAGEISNFRAPGSGHLYFTLKDETATLSAVMFQREARRIGFALTDGQAVLAKGTITVYEARGQYQIQVAEIRPRGQGSLQQRFEELKRRLAAEDLFSLERKRP